MVTIRMLILNNKGHLLVYTEDDHLRVPYKLCLTNESYSSFEDAAFVELKSGYYIEDIHPKDFYLYYMSNHIENGEIFLNITYRGNSKVRKLPYPLPYAEFMELRDIKKNIDLFTDPEDQQIIRRFIIREDNPTLL